MAHISLRQAPEDRLRRLLAQSLGEEQASSLLSEFGGGPEPLTLPELARRIGNQEGDANRLRFRPQNRPAADFAAGLNFLQRGGLPVSARVAPSAGGIIQPRGPQPLSGVRPVGAPDAAQEAAPSAGRPPDPQTQSALTAAAVATAQANARAARRNAQSPLDFAKEAESAASFRARTSGIDIDVGDAAGPIEGRTLNLRGVRPRIEEGGSVALARDAGRFADPNFEAAQEARRADVRTGVGTAGGVSPAIQTALINQERDTALIQDRQDRLQSSATIQRLRDEFLAQGATEQQAIEQALRVWQTRVQGSSAAANQQQAAFEEVEPGFLGLGGTPLDPASQALRDQQQTLLQGGPGVPEAGAAPDASAAGGAVPQAVQNALLGQPDGPYTLSDGSRWIVTGGVVTPVQ